MAIFSGKVTAKLGQASGDCETISNLKEISWRRVPRDHVRAQTVMNTTIPVGWYQGHKWMEVDIRVLSEAYEAFYHNGATNKAYIVEDGKNVIIPYFEAFMVDDLGKEWKATFTDAIPIRPEEPYRDGEDTIHTYRLLAKKVVITKPA